jgi:hypothetical protein
MINPYLPFCCCELSLSNITDEFSHSRVRILGELTSDNDTGEHLTIGAGPANYNIYEERRKAFRKKPKKPTPYDAMHTYLIYMTSVAEWEITQVLLDFSYVF